MTIRSEIAHTAVDSWFDVLYQVADKIIDTIERQQYRHISASLVRDLKKAVEWKTEARVYQDLIERKVLVEQEEEERYSWAHEEIGWAVCCFNHLSTNIPIEIVIEQDGDEEIYVVLESEDR
jgi:hypothetical protein